MGADGDRILVQLSGTPQLPIICLHNSPTNLVAVSRYDSVVSETMVAGVSQSPQALGDTMPPRLGVQAGLQRDSIASKLS
jgi:hypothetical protein